MNEAGPPERRAFGEGGRSSASNNVGQARAVASARPAIRNEGPTLLTVRRGGGRSCSASWAIGGAGLSRLGAQSG
jgi:hypothetical protein